MTENSGGEQRLIVGITGASGAQYGVRLLEALQDSPIETHLVISRAGMQTLSLETDYSLDYVKSLADIVYSSGDIGAAIASGSFKTMGMAIAPCSIKSLSEIAYGLTTNLISRAADVVLKERRKLVLLVRETPLHSGHLKTMLQASDNGAIIMPPVPAFYSRPNSLDDIVNHTVGRTLDLFGVDNHLVRRWKEDQS